MNIEPLVVVHCARQRPCTHDQCQDMSCRVHTEVQQLNSLPLPLQVEPYWNPYIEAQAISRADRMGQTKVVEVYKLYVPGVHARGRVLPQIQCEVVFPNALFKQYRDLCFPPIKCPATCLLHARLSELADKSPDKDKEPISWGHVAQSGLLCADTVEERIFKLQDYKSVVVDTIMGQSDIGSAASSKVTKEEMLFVLGRRDSLLPSTT